MKTPKQAADEYTGYQEDEAHAHFMAGYCDAMNQMHESTQQNKEAFQWLLIVLQQDKRSTEQFISDHPHIGLQLPAEKDSLNYKWTQWAKQKIENLK